VDEKGSTVPEARGIEAGAGAVDLEASAGHTSRLERRLKALERRQRPTEPHTALKLLTTNELRLVLGLVERGGVLPSGDVRRPEVFRSPPPEESEAMERWRQLCGEPLDHLEVAEELLDRVGDAHGWYARETVHAALVLTRLELPDASSWFVGKRAEAVLNLYAELEEHRGEPQHPHVRGAVRRLKRLKEMSRLAPEPASDSLEDDLPRAALERPTPPHRPSESAVEDTPSSREAPGVPTGAPWWRRWLGW
jgi:hypothetical protein